MKKILFVFLMAANFLTAAAQEAPEDRAFSQFHKTRPTAFQALIKAHSDAIIAQDARKDTRFFGRTGWLIFGTESYDFCGISDHDLLKARLKKNRGTGEPIRMLDIGSGDHAWVYKKAAEISPLLTKDQHAEIFAITANNVPTRSLAYSDQVTLHLVGQSDAHVLIESLQSGTGLGADTLLDSFDIIVSHWALFHMLDPIGIVTQAIALLKPGGLLCHEQFQAATNPGPYRLSWRDQAAMMFYLDHNIPFVRAQSSVVRAQYIAQKPLTGLLQTVWQYDGDGYDTHTQEDRGFPLHYARFSRREHSNHVFKTIPTEDAQPCFQPLIGSTALISQLHGEGVRLKKPKDSQSDAPGATLESIHTREVVLALPTQETQNPQGTQTASGAGGS